MSQSDCQVRFRVSYVKISTVLILYTNLPYIAASTTSPLASIGDAVMPKTLGRFDGVSLRYKSRIILSLC